MAEGVVRCDGEAARGKEREELRLCNNKRITDIFLIERHNITSRRWYTYKMLTIYIKIEKLNRIGNTFTIAQ